MPKHPRPSSRMQGMSEQKNADTWNKQPRPLKDGNWVCEDPHCANVNYPRRTECYKCGKRRGPMGDAVVKAYIETLKMARGELPLPVTIIPPVIGGTERVGLARGMLAHNVFDMPQQSSCSSLLNELDPWMGTCFEQPLSFGSQYVTGDRGFHGRRSTLSAATEGKRLAEHLVASFAASSDPIGDAGECLASAALWLQTMKSRIQAEEGSLSTASLVSVGSPTFAGLPMPLSGINGTVNMLSQSQFNASTGALGIGNMLARSSMSNSPGPRQMPRANLKWEDYKDRPSDFLREFGDPAAVTASAMGGGPRPEPGVNGNWECEECKNVNFPRRTSCFQCHKKRGSKGDDTVRKYVRSLFEDADAIHV